MAERRASSIVPATPSTSALAQRPAQLTAEEVMERFFARRSLDTVRGYRGDLQHFARWLEGKGLVAEPEPAAVARFLFSLHPGRANALLMEWVQAMEMEPRGKSRTPLAPKTVNRRLSSVKSLVKLGRTLGLITWSLDVPGVRKPRNVRDMRGPRVEQVRAMLDGVRGEPFASALLHLLFTRGLRSVEVRELRLKHLRLENATIYVRGKGKAGLEPLTVGEGTIEALRTWLRAREGDASPDSFLFTQRGGQPLSHVTLWRVVRRAARQTGIEARPHGLRHSAITAVLNETHGDLRTAQRFSRHAKPETLLMYDDERRDLGGEVAKRLDKMMEKGKGD